MRINIKIMSSYLISWKSLLENPEKGWPEEKLAKLAHSVRENGPRIEPWRFNRKKGLVVGERIFLVRQGKRGHAILGYGRIHAIPMSSDDRISIIFEALVDPTSDKVFATADELQKINAGKLPWGTQSSGIKLKMEIAEALENMVVGRTPVFDQKRTPPNINPNWTRDELILALDLYFREPSARKNSAHSECIRLSETLNALPIHHGKALAPTFRNRNSVAMKLNNFLKYDSQQTGLGLSAGSRLEKEVWDTFSGNLQHLKSVAKAILNGAKSLIDVNEKVFEEDEFEAEEGKILTATHKKRERNSILVRRKKKQVKQKTGKLLCEVCGFDFAVVYGALGEDFAECHHGRSVSSMLPEEKTKLSDLHIVCANCHRMLHKKRPWPSIEQLRAVILSCSSITHGLGFKKT